MLTYRSFRNTDPLLLSALWRAHAGRRGWPAHMTTDVLEQLVFSKLYFDRDGLILAFDDERFLGYVHAGFGPSADRESLSQDVGVISLVLMQPGVGRGDAAVGLVEQAEAFLRARGATSLLGGVACPDCPFYAGMYGSSEPPGVLDDDVVFRDALVARGFAPAERTVTYQRELSDFEAVIDRRQMEIRRRMVAQVTLDAPARTWWEACVWGEYELTRLELMPRGATAPAAFALVRSRDPLGVSAATRGAGLMDIEVDEAYRRRGLAVFLLSEAFRQFARQGVATVAAQVVDDSPARKGLFLKLGLTPALMGTVFRKDS